MDITFKCPNCDQELEVDASGSGSTIECPSCSRSITVPASEAQNGEPGVPASTPAMAAPIAASAAAKVERHFSVPERTGPGEALIQKASRPLEIAAKDTEKKVRIKTF